MGAPEGIFLLVAKVPMIASDILGGYFIYKLVLKLRNGNEALAIRALALYVFNPLLILSTAIWGTFDTVSALFVILSLYFLLCEDSAIKAGICFGISVGVKVYPIFILPVFLMRIRRRRQKSEFLVLSLAVPGIATLPFLVMNSTQFLTGVAILYTSGGSFSIWSEFVTPLLQAYGAAGLGAVAIVLTVVLVTGIGVLLIFMRKSKTDLATGCLIVLTFALLMNQKVHENYFTWILPFLILLPMNKKYLNIIWVLPFIHATMFNAMWSWVGGPSGIFYWFYITYPGNVNLLTALPASNLITPMMVLATYVACVSLIISRLRTRGVQNKVLLGDTGRKSIVTVPKRSGGDKSTLRIATAGLIVMFVSLGALAIPTLASNEDHYAPIFSTSDIMPGGIYHGVIWYVSSGFSYRGQVMTKDTGGGDFWNIGFPLPAEELRIATAISSGGSGVHVVAGLLANRFSVALRVWNSTSYAYIRIILIGTRESNMSNAIKTFLVYPENATGQTLTWNFSSYDFIESGKKSDLLSQVAGQYDQQLEIVATVYDAYWKAIPALTQLQVMLELGTVLEVF
jgi:Gpi18-like mannosyltransferase